MDYLIKQKPYVNAYPPKQEIKITGHIIFEFLHHVEWPKKIKNEKQKIEENVKKKNRKKK